MRISVSQMKTFNVSPSKRAGHYILGIKDNFTSDALILGQIFENYLVSGKDEYNRILENKQIFDIEGLLEDYDNLKFNAQGLGFEKGELQYRVEGELFGHKFLGYIDNFRDGCVEDIKTVRYLSKEKEKQKPNMRSGLTYYEEYELQLWAYMKILGMKKGKILEVSKHKYKDKKPRNQIIEFQWSDEWDKKMEKEWKPKVNDMYLLYNKFNYVLTRESGQDNK